LLSIGVVTIFAITTFILLALQCRPLSLTWGEGKGSCFPAHVITDVAYAFSAADIASGWLYAVSRLASILILSRDNVANT
jgi:hypothetical protein